MSKKKQQVIDQAVLLFSKHGYNNICVDKICEESNVSKMTVYKYFPTKELLFEAALEERNKTFINELNSTISKHSTPADKLKSLFVFYHHWFNHKDFSGCLFINSLSFFYGTNESVIKHVKENKRLITGTLESLLSPLMNSSKINSTSSHIAKLLDGAIISAQVGLEKNPANSAWLASASLLSSHGAEIEVTDLDI